MDNKNRFLKHQYLQTIKNNYKYAQIFTIFANIL